VLRGPIRNPREFLFFTYDAASKQARRRIGDPHPFCERAFPKKRDVNSSVKPDSLEA